MGQKGANDNFGKFVSSSYRPKIPPSPFQNKESGGFSGNSSGHEVRNPDVN
jgi:hypothetical protein